MTRNAKLLTRDSWCYSLLPETSLLNFIFTGVDATGALSRDVKRCGIDFNDLYHFFQPYIEVDAMKLSISRFATF